MRFKMKFSLTPNFGHQVIYIKKSLAAEWNKCVQILEKETKPLIKKIIIITLSD